MKLKLEKKRKYYEEEKFNDYLNEGVEEIRKFLNKKRERLVLQVQKEKNLKIKRLNEEIRRLEEDARIQIEKIDEDMKIEENNKIAKIKEIIEEEIIFKKIREKNGNNPKEDYNH